MPVSLVAQSLADGRHGRKGQAQDERCMMHEKDATGVQRLSRTLSPEDSPYVSLDSRRVQQALKGAVESNGVLLK